MNSNKGQYIYEIWEEHSDVWASEPIARGVIDDPFIRTVIRPQGWRAAWAVLRGKLTFRVRVDWTHAAHRVVFLWDYQPPEEGPTRPMGVYGGEAEAEAL